MDKFIIIFKKISSKFDFLAAMIILGISILVVANILLRRLLGSPIHGVYEYVCYLTVFAISLALANCALQDGHINITFLLEKFSAKIQKVILIVFGVFVLGTFSLIIWNLADYAREMYLLGYVSSVVRIPLEYIMAIIVAGFLILTISIFIKLVEDVKKTS